MNLLKQLHNRHLCIKLPQYRSPNKLSYLLTTLWPMVKVLYDEDCSPKPSCVPLKTGTSKPNYICVGTAKIQESV